MPNPENPYDEMLKKIAKMVEELLRNLPQEENARIIGCTIITNGGVPHFARNPKFESDESDIPVEIIDSPDMLFVTARLPNTLHTAPYADITPESLHIVVNERRIPVPLLCKIDIIHSFYEVRHGVIDITLKKKLPQRVPRKVRGEERHSPLFPGGAVISPFFEGKPLLVFLYWPACITVVGGHCRVGSCT